VQTEQTVTLAIEPLPRSTPEDQGVSSRAIAGFVDAVEKSHCKLHSVMLLRHGQVVAEGWWAPYAPAGPHMLFSLTKSFTATAVGLALGEGRLSLDDLVLSFFPDDAPAGVSENLAAMRVRHLLSMSTGHAEDPTPKLHEHPGGDWAQITLAQPVTYEPGTHFVYNSAASYLLSATVQKVTGVNTVDYLRRRLFGPLGIVETPWEVSAQGINVGGWGLSLTTENIARFGQLYLQRGVWRGQRLLPEGWVEVASSRQVSNGDDPESDWAQGYGFQFWRCRHGA
jgi:CubicO group peptidase (beta-lactamase class C family)